jgi:hypothetical protein
VGHRFFGHGRKVEAAASINCSSVSLPSRLPLRACRIFLEFGNAPFRVFENAGTDFTNGAGCEALLDHLYDLSLLIVQWRGGYVTSKLRFTNHTVSRQKSEEFGMFI